MGCPSPPRNWLQCVHFSEHRWSFSGQLPTGDFLIPSGSSSFASNRGTHCYVVFTVGVWLNCCCGFFSFGRWGELFSSSLFILPYAGGPRGKPDSRTSYAHTKHMAPVMATEALAHKKGDSLVLPLAVTAIGAVCLWKLYHRCFIHVNRDCVTVVYETRRNSVLATSMDKERRAGEDLPQISHFRPAMYVVGMLLYSSRNMVVVPPSSFFNTFTLPRSVFDEQSTGEVVSCTVEGIQVTDGCFRMVLTIRYCIPFDQLERYLAAVGPKPPNERIAMAAAAVARARGSKLSVGLILNKTKGDAAFLEPFREHLSSKLISEAAVRLINATVESAEIAGKT